MKTPPRIPHFDSREIIHRRARQTEIGVWICVALAAISFGVLVTMAIHALTH